MQNGLVGGRPVFVLELEPECHSVLPSVSVGTDGTMRVSREGGVLRTGRLKTDKSARPNLSYWKRGRGPPPLSLGLAPPGG
jgi:hypothetical protein